MSIECFTTLGGQRALAVDDGENIIITPCVSAGAVCGCDPTSCLQARALAAVLPSPGRRFDSMKATVGDLVDVNRKVGAWRDIKVRDQGVPTVSGASVWDTADAPDDCFAVVPDAARGPRGNKSLRKLPLASVERKQFDPVIVRNALTAFKEDADSLLSGTGIAKDDALGKICSAARELGIDSPLCTGMEWSRTVNVPPGRPVASATSHFFDHMQPTIGDLVGVKTVEAAASCPPVTRRINGKLDLSQPTVGDLSVRGHTSLRAISIQPDDFVLHPRKVRMCSR